MLRHDSPWETTVKLVDHDCWYALHKATYHTVLGPGNADGPSFDVSS